jgi:hypothetical protein
VHLVVYSGHIAIRAVYGRSNSCTYRQSQSQAAPLRQSFGTDQ